MSSRAIPNGGITLCGPQTSSEDAAAGGRSALVLDLSNSILQDVTAASKEKSGLHFIAGNTPKLRLGGRTIELNISPERFRNELYISTAAGSLDKLTLHGIVSHRIQPKHAHLTHGEDTAGSDAALAALQSSLASYEQEKQANQTNITSSIIPTPKSRFDAARKQKQDARRSRFGLTASPSLSAAGSPSLGPAPTSAPTNDLPTRLSAFRTPLIHLLAIQAIAFEDIFTRTHIPKTDLKEILAKIGKAADGKWQLTDRAYKELDVWKFRYRLKSDRQAAIDNSIKAYDRLRLGKEEKIWQLLLPKEERDKGVVLSRLHLGTGQVNRGLTPHYAASPAAHLDGATESMAPSVANTPRLGATPRPTSSKGGDVMKRLLSKDPKKARAQEEAKEKRRKEREAARETAHSDREGAKFTRRPTTKKINPKVKSTELVESSDDGSADEGEVKEALARVDSKTTSDRTAVRAKATTSTSNSAANGAGSSEKLGRQVGNLGTKSGEAAGLPKTITSPAVKAAKSVKAGNSTPRGPDGLSAPESQQKSQLSPQKPDSRPNVPSPLGAARPRVASDVSDQTAIGVQRSRPGTATGADTPKGLGITNGVRKRQDTVTSTASTISSGSDNKQAASTTNGIGRKPITNGDSIVKAPSTNGDTHRRGLGLKRKHDDAALSSNDYPALKLRKTSSSASQPPKPPLGKGRATHNSPDAAIESGSSDSAASVLDTITYTQGVNLAEKFRDQYYPMYAKMYDDLEEKQRSGGTVSKDERERLWAMHRRLEQMKREIQTASEREHGEE